MQVQGQRVGMRCKVRRIEVRVQAECKFCTPSRCQSRSPVQVESRLLSLTQHPKYDRTNADCVGVWQSRHYSVHGRVRLTA